MNRHLQRALRPVRRAYALATRPVTLGVRLAAFDAAGRVFLVRHTYMRGWYLPGGAVDPGEAAGDAVRREAREEGNLELPEAPELLGVFVNQLEARDHVLLYRAGGVQQSAPRAPDREIAEGAFFSPDRLPADATPATLRRLAEIGAGGPYPPEW
ncbi:NUDIX domain-containing protein [Aureimonas jatrophae]|uniref:ADP-ribose pyrophosphatase YjhB, NUDIX family n=1 Tax=Aureimonas jatrophae TaxID=1166073 RepID=A0A1H0EM87_9HYPH|nr:NUDIX domain-containing protein [Aureimonas jatrophae]MBB3950424.1 ADP-ribose pyrophosphatase YjhB (NUDIX family) [Aureimonas jatrophae]SDN83567.1 ADP-ribose pyrophosphatase YjhB, NUDIX family [Aureimonas jatrophae]